MDASPWQLRDRLARVLQTLRMRGVFYCHSELSEPWAFEMPVVADSVSLHVVSAGSCVLRVDGADPIDLHAGDVALVPHGVGHDLRSAPTARPVPRVEELPQQYVSPSYSVLRHGGGGRATRLICGIVAFDDPAARELLRRLPRILVVGSDSPAMGSSIRDTLRLMADELTHPGPGAEAVATRLAEILIVQVIRAWLTQAPGARQGWLLALQDDRIGRALEAMHLDPGRAWTAASLARTAAMSRSAFSARFTSMVGEAPIAYLTRWRMSVAELRLRDGDATVAQLADELGYRSEAAFTRAFTRIVGQTPGAARRRARETAIATA